MASHWNGNLIHIKQIFSVPLMSSMSISTLELWRKPSSREIKVLTILLLKCLNLQCPQMAKYGSPLKWKPDSHKTDLQCPIDVQHVHIYPGIMEKTQLQRNQGIDHSIAKVPLTILLLNWMTLLCPQMAKYGSRWNGNLIHITQILSVPLIPSMSIYTLELWRNQGFDHSISKVPQFAVSPNGQIWLPIEMETWFI